MQDSSQSQSQDDFSVSILCFNIFAIADREKGGPVGDLASKADEPIEVREAAQPDPPEIRYWVEYRQMKDAMLLLTKDVTKNKKLMHIHEGPVFDVVQVNYTSETTDTKKTEQTAFDQGTKPIAQIAGSLPSVQVRGRTYIRIHSRAIINALQSVVNHYPFFDLVSQPVEVDWPYAILVHHWTELEQFREAYNTADGSEVPDECSMNDTYRHLGLLLDFLEDAIGEKVRAERARWAQPVPMASFGMLWLLFKPGSDIYEHQDLDDNKEAFVVSRVKFHIFDEAWDTYEVESWYLHSDATSVRPQSTTLRMSRFQGEKPIHELEFFPCEYYPEHATRRQELINRSRLGLQLTQRKCMYFDGQSYETPRQHVSFVTVMMATSTHIWQYKGYVMVDPAQQFEDDVSPPPLETSIILDQKLSQLPLCSCVRCASINSERNRLAKFAGYKRIAFKDTDEMTDHQCFIYANVASAFVLALRSWST